MVKNGRPSCLTGFVVLGGTHRIFAASREKTSYKWTDKPSTRLKNQQLDSKYKVNFSHNFNTV